jgi:hypothetical protein
MREWAPRSGALLLSLLLHALLLLMVQSLRLQNLAFRETAPLPVKILERRVPPVAKAVPKPPPPKVAPPAPAEKPAPAPPPVEEAKPEPPPPPPKKEIPLPEQQIVMPPDAGKEEPPPDTRFLSERDNKVEKQTMKKGEPAPGDDGLRAERQAEKVGERKSRRDAPREEGRQVKSLPRLDQLLPSAVQLAREGYGQAAPEAEAAEQEASPKADRLRSGQVWLPRSEVRGTLDFLPDVQPGDITLLNTKAERFAPFVRRVALRVFQNLLISLRRELSNATRSNEEAVSMEALMSRAGDLVGTNVTKRSPRVPLSSDRLLQQACNDGFFDRNPPPGAEAADGKIHFVLQTHVVSIVDTAGQRYGYQITFEAGLL